MIAPQAALAELIGEDGARRRPPWRQIFIGLSVAAVLALAAYAAYQWLQPAVTSYTTQLAKRGDLVAKVAATGALEPLNTVTVGSEISGAIEAVLVDDNDHVKKGQVLARLDTARLADDIARAQASLASAQAQVQQAEATAREAGLTHQRNVDLFERSQGAYVAKAVVDGAAAAKARADASVLVARAQVVQAQATLRSNQTNLAKATIRSPVDGVVLNRAIEPGQTVAASFQAPTLFTLAEDLTRMELKVNIDEADISQVRDGQPAEFFVDAYPDRIFQARVRRVSIGSQTVSGVVSYGVVLSVENQDLSLRPGMTATAEITTALRKEVLQVPTAALRFRPAATQQEKGDFVDKLMPKMGPPGRSGRGGRTPQRAQDTVYVMRAGVPTATPVSAGPAAGEWTQILSGNLKPGDPVIVSARAPGA